MISARKFRLAFNRYLKFHDDYARSEGNRRVAFQSFRAPGTLGADWEGYKRVLAAQAMETLDLSSWSREKIGSGEIKKSVIRAIELRSNNLVYWQPKQGPKSVVHLNLKAARAGSRLCTELERLFYGLFKHGRADRETFEALAKLLGKRYELLAYLYFVADPLSFLPIRTTYFDRALALLGVDLRTRSRCSWENYQDFLGSMKEVQSRLVAEGISDAELIDAHSFCWILIQYETDSPPLEERSQTTSRDFAGEFALKRESAPMPAPEDAAPQDMQKGAEKRIANGEIAEEIVLEEERARLRRANRQDLADRVRDVSGQPGFGYDIQSFEKDGRKRCIEVKNVSNGSRFFLSSNELAKSRGTENYWFYLVQAGDSGRNVVEFVAAERLRDEFLEPVQYLVRFSR